MVAYANANRNLTFTYVDYRLSKYSVAGNNAQIPTTQLIRNVGGAGRIITRVFMGVQDRTPGLRAMNGQYRADAPERDYSNGATSVANVNGTATLNLKYNDTFLYPVDVDNSARHFHNTASTEGLTPYTTREVYSAEGESLSGGSLQVASTVKSFTGPPGAHIDTDLSGTAFFVGWRLGDNQRINSRGIELYMTWSNSVASASGYLQRVWLETIKQLTLENGRVSIQFA